MKALSTLALALTLSSAASAQTQRYEDLANLPFTRSFLSDSAISTLTDELTFQRATQAYLWALPALNMYGMKEVAALGIEQGKPFAPDAKTKTLLDLGAKTAFRFGHTITYDGPKYYPDRQWLNPFPGGSAEFVDKTASQIDNRTGFFTYAYSTSPGMAANIPNVGAKYPNAFRDANGEFLFGGNNYKLNLPKDIPAALFWSVTLYDPITGSGLDNGQPFPSLNAMDKPIVNADGSTDIYFGPTSPGPGTNWMRTIPEKGFFVILRLYGPKQAFFDKTWKPGDLEKIN